MQNSDQDVTQLLAMAEGGDDAAHDELMRHVYAELRDVARHKLRHEKPGISLEHKIVYEELTSSLLTNPSCG